MPPPPSDWSTRHSVHATARRTAALVNVLVGDDAPRPAAVVRVLRAYGETDPLDVPPADVAALRTAAFALHDVFAAGATDAAALRLDTLLGRAAGGLRLTSHGGAAPWHPHLDGDDDAPWDEWFLASSCLALTVLLWDRQRPPGGVCAAPGCRRVYLFLGSGPTRRYCSRRCATRERVAAHRRAARARTGGAGPAAPSGDGG